MPTLQTYQDTLSYAKQYLANELTNKEQTDPLSKETVEDLITMGKAASADAAQVVKIIEMNERSMHSEEHKKSIRKLLDQTNEDYLIITLALTYFLKAHSDV